MVQWFKDVQTIVEGIDAQIENRADEALTLHAVASRMGYSPYHMTRKFKEVSGVTFRCYLQGRRLAYAAIDLRDTKKTILEIAVDYGFASHAAFTRAFKKRYDITPAAYRKNPVPLVLRTRINSFDRYLLDIGGIGMVQNTGEIKVYFIVIPAHKFMHIKNYKSDGYFDFWKEQAAIPGQDCDTICGLLDSIKGKLDGDDSVTGTFSGQLMSKIYEAGGKVAEAYGVRLSPNYSGPVPKQMLMMDVPEGEYIVFEHGPFNYETECEPVAERLEEEMAHFDYEATDYRLAKCDGRLSYFYLDPTKYQKYVLPVIRK